MLEGTKTTDAVRTFAPYCVRDTVSLVGEVQTHVQQMNRLCCPIQSILCAEFFVFCSNRFDDFLSSSPSQVHATTLSCRSSAPTTSENSRMIRRQSLDFICACTNGTRSFARRYAWQQCTATVQRLSRSWLVLGQRGRNYLDDLGSHQTFRYSSLEIAGRCMMRLVTTCTNPWSTPSSRSRSSALSLSPKIASGSART